MTQGWWKFNGGMTATMVGIVITGVTDTAAIAAAGVQRWVASWQVRRLEAPSPTAGRKLPRTTPTAPSDTSRTTRAPGLTWDTTAYGIHVPDLDRVLPAPTVRNAYYF